MSDLVELVINDLTKTMRTTLTPFIEKIESTNKQYQTLIDIMSNMPEFKQLVEENIQLKKELLNITVNNVKTVRVEDVVKVEDVAEVVEDNMTHNTMSVTLEITQLSNAVDSNLNMTEHVKEIYDSVTTRVYTLNGVETEDEEEEEEEDEDEDEEDEDDEEEEVEEEKEVVVEELVVEEEVVLEEEDEEVFIVEIDGVEFYTSDEINGIIYKITNNEEVGDKVGQFTNGEPTFL